MRIKRELGRVFVSGNVGEYATFYVKISTIKKTKNILENK
jgi:hypothetical protein